MFGILWELVVCLLIGYYLFLFHFMLLLSYITHVAYRLYAYIYFFKGSYLLLNVGLFDSSFIGGLSMANDLLETVSYIL